MEGRQGVHFALINLRIDESLLCVEKGSGIRFLFRQGGERVFHLPSFGKWLNMSTSPAQHSWFLPLSSQR
jgi:hypothetical protein